MVLWINSIILLALNWITTQLAYLGGSYTVMYGIFTFLRESIEKTFRLFTVVDIGSSGSQSDGGIFSRSAIGRKFSDGTLQIPGEKKVGNETLPHVILSDDAFPLKVNLMKPFPGKSLTRERRVYNYRMSRARMVVENTFGIPAARWRILHTLIIADTELINQIVEGTVILHNFLMNKNDNSITPDKFDNGNLVEGSWREEVPSKSNFTSIAQQGSHNFTNSAATVRDKFMNNFNSVDGMVQWQDDRI